MSNKADGYFLLLEIQNILCKLNHIKKNMNEIIPFECEFIKNCNESYEKLSDVENGLKNRLEIDCCPPLTVKLDELEEIVPASLDNYYDGSKIITTINKPVDYIKFRINFDGTEEK